MWKIGFLEKRKVAEGTKIYSFDKPDDFQFTEGQYIEMELFNVKDPEVSHDSKHFFSIASSSCDETLDFLTRVRESKFKQALDSLVRGDKVGISESEGSFVLEESGLKNSDGEILLIVGGVGISAARAIIRGVECHNEAKYKESLKLLYSNRSVESAAVLDELADIGWLDQSLFFTRRVSRGSLQEVYGDKIDAIRVYEERIDSSHFKRLTNDFDNARFFVVGPPGFVRGMKGVLLDLGVVRDYIFSDSFAGY
ncbi:hypothetical protein GF357_03620 [Candidatus Dojkabacteria bacterium]|nr:hypothetical protein [Candidatus Dojkabacteria bacterium]